MTRPIFEDGYSKEIGRGAYRTSQLERRPETPGGLAVFAIKVFFDDELVNTLRPFKLDIPEDLDEAVLVKAEAWITTESSSGDVVVSLYNDTQTQDMLSTPLTIDVGDKNSRYSGTPHVVDTGADDVAWADEIWVNVDNAGTDAVGLGVTLYFMPSGTANIVIHGARGTPGGATAFQGAWQDSTTYNAGDIVTNNGIAYVALQDHTSNAANDEPGVGTNEGDFWAPVVEIPMAMEVPFIIDGGGYSIIDGVKGATRVPAAGTIVNAALYADVAGDVEVDIWKCDHAGYHPTIADSITGAAPLTLTGAIKNIDSTLTGWDTSLVQGDILVYYLPDDAFAISRLTVTLLVLKD